MWPWRRAAMAECVAEYHLTSSMIETAGVRHRSAPRCSSHTFELVQEAIGDIETAVSPKAVQG
jgi:hypothetical protein